jgi:hypothetical protein
MSPPIDPRDFATIQPDRWYRIMDVARVFRRTREVVSRWIKTGKIAAIPDPVVPRRKLIRGAEILAKAAPLLVDSYGPSETPKQRECRSESAMDRVRRAKSK